MSSHKLEIIIEHEQGCSWFMTDGDVCNCKTETKVKQIKLLFLEIMVQAEQAVIRKMIDEIDTYDFNNSIDDFKKEMLKRIVEEVTNLS